MATVVHVAWVHPSPPPYCDMNTSTRMLVDGNGEGRRQLSSVGAWWCMVAQAGAAGVQTHRRLCSKLRRTGGGGATPRGCEAVAAPPTRCVR